MLQQFLSQLKIRILPRSTCSPTALVGGQEKDTAAEHRQPDNGNGSPLLEGESSADASLFAAVRNDRENSRGEDVERTHSPTATFSLPSPPAVCDRFLRSLSRDTASVRCRVELYNQELSRTRDEAEALISQATEPLCRDSSSTMSAMEDGGRGRRKEGCAVAEVTSSAAGGLYAGGGEGAQLSTIFCRVSPVERANQSHPRIDLKLLPCTPREANKCVPPTTGREKRACFDAAATGDANGADKIGNGDGCGNNKSKRKDMIAALLAAASATDGGSLSRVQSSGSPSRVKTSGSPPRLPSSPSGTRRQKNDCSRLAVVNGPINDTCFDPPSVRNGLTGLTTAQVDEVLLRVEASTPGARSCWKSPVKGEREVQGGGGGGATSHTDGCVGMKEQQRRQEQSARGGSNGGERHAGTMTRARESGGGGGGEAQQTTGNQQERTRTPWEEIRRVIRTPRSGIPPPPDSRNR